MLTKLDLHYLDDTRPVYACKGCSEVVVRDSGHVKRVLTTRRCRMKWSRAHSPARPAGHSEEYRYSVSGNPSNISLMNSTINTDLGKREERNLT